MFLYKLMYKLIPGPMKHLRKLFRQSEVEYASKFRQTRRVMLFGDFANIGLRVPTASTVRALSTSRNIFAFQQNTGSRGTIGTTK